MFRPSLHKLITNLCANSQRIRWPLSILSQVVNHAATGHHTILTLYTVVLCTLLAQKDVISDRPSICAHCRPNVGAWRYKPYFLVWMCRWCIPSIGQGLPTLADIQCFLRWLMLGIGTSSCWSRCCWGSLQRTSCKCQLLEGRSRIWNSASLTKKAWYRLIKSELVLLMLSISL